MIDRSNVARASKSASVRVGRDALLRKALLGTTALIGIGLALPAAAQTIASPTAGGTITASGGTPSVNDQTASGGSVTITNLSQATVLTVNGVTINDTTGTTSANALDIRGSTSGLNSTGATLAGANHLTTTVSGGSALYVQTNANMGVGFTSSGSVFTGSYGINLNAPSGYISFDSTGYSQSFIGNGTAVAGINAISSVNAGIQIGGSTISGFATGVNASNFYGTGFVSTGGSINATSVGLQFTATGGGSTVNSQSAITAPTGILSNDTTGSTITTSGNGTINAVSAGNGTGISVNSTGSGVTTVTVGAAIGNTTAFDRGVSITTGNPSTATLNVTTTAAITAATYGLYLQAWLPAGRGTIDIGANITAGTAIYNAGGVYDYIIRSGATVTSTAAGASALSSGNTGSTLNNAGTLRATGTGSAGVQLYGVQSATNSGTIEGAAYGIWLLNTTTINNTGTVQGGTSAGIYGSVGTVNNTGAGALITGNTGITTTTNPLTLVNSGTVSGTTWGIVSGGTTTNITSSGTISGTTGAIQLNATGTQSVNLQSGSTTTGDITATNNGQRTITAAGTLTGGYDATGGANTAVDIFTLSATGNVSGAIALGDGNDSFTYKGGTLGSTVDGGTGTDAFIVDIGASTNATLNQSNFTNFDSFNLTTGNLTLTGSRSGGAGWTVAGGNATTFILNGSLTNIAGVAVTLTTPDLMFVQSGAQLSATGDIIYSSGTGNNIQNSGTITSGTGLSSAIAFGSGTVDNYGTITYAAGGSIATQGNGILASTNQLSLSNHTGATLIGRWDGARANNGAYVVNDGLIQGDRFAGVEITGTSVVQNNATGRIYGASGEGSGLLINGGAVQVTNAGQIVGAGGAAISNGGSGLLSLNNSGTIATGTLDGSNNYVAGGSNTGIRSSSANITNTGLIEGQAGGILTTGALTLVNTGTINGRGTGTPNYDGINVGGVASILNAGTISQSTYAGIYAGGGGTITNAAAGTLTGGNAGAGGVAVALGAGGTFNNYGTANSASGNGVAIGNTGATVNLFAGSTTGSITGGSGNDTLAIYTGQTNGSALTQAYTDAVSGASANLTLQNGGTLAAATFGAVDLGTGSDTLQLRGIGTGGQAGSFSLATSTGAETITKLDSGTWTLTGAAAVSGITVNSNAGMLQFLGTSGIGAINANGGIVRANGAGAFGSAVVHLLSSNVQFGASGAYANNFVLDVPAVLNGQPAVFENLFGGNAILSGSITSGSGTNAAGQAIGTSQAVTFTGIANSLFNLTGTGNSWTGITTINSGVTVRGSTSAISGGSITNNGTLTYVQSGASSSGAVISGSGALRVEGGQVTLTGFNTYTGGTTVAGGSLQVGNGSGSGRITGAITVDSGGTLIFNRNDNYDFTSAISGAGNVQALGTVSLSGAITNTGMFTVDSATGGQVTLTGSRNGAGSSGVWIAGAGNVLRVGLTGSVVGGEYVGVRLGGVGDDVDNFGSITNVGTSQDNGYGAAIAVVATSGTSTINNGSASNSSATINGQNAGINHVGSGGIVATGLLTVNNYGLIAGNLYNAIENQGGSGALTVTNNASGRIVGQGNAGGGNGIGMGGTGALTLTNAGQIVGRTNGVATGASVSITNSGTISSGILTGGTSGGLTVGSGVGVSIAGGSITNQSGGLITGGNAISSSATLTLANAGTLTGTGNGVFLTTGGLTVTSNTGTITGGNGLYGAIYSAGDVTLQNYAGTTTGGAWGVLTQGTLNATITGGTITGTSRNALYAAGANSIVTNAGTLIGGNAAIYADGANLSVTNTGTIRITGGSANTIVSGIYASAAGAQVTNSGLIESTLASGRGVYLLAGGTVTNNAGGTISGGIEGVRAEGAVTITNNSTISGTTAAINLVGTFNDTVTLNAGSTTTGAINLGAGNDTLNWNGGSFTSVDAGAGTDVFNINLAAPATLNLANVTGFETQNLLGGTLTLTGTQTGQGGWTLSAGTTLNIGATGQAANLTTNLATAFANTNNVTINVAAGSTAASSNGRVVSATGAGLTVNNAGTMTATTTSAIYMTGANSSVVNSGTITGLTGTGSLTPAVFGNGAGSSVVNNVSATITGRRGVELDGANSSITNSGTITGTSDNAASLLAGGTITNNAGGTLTATTGGGYGAYVFGGAGTVINNGTINAVTGVVVDTNATNNVTNTGTITASGTGIAAANGTMNLTNSGTITATNGYGVNVAGGDATITNQANGTINGGTAGAMALNSAGTVNVNLAANSTTNGNIVSTGAGTRSLDIAGAFNGTYDASAGSGVDTVTMHAGSSLTGADLGDGDDVFNYYGGTIAGMVNGGNGTDTLNGNFGAGTDTTVTLANFTGFEKFGFTSGDVTVTGPSASPDAAIYAENGGTVTFSGTQDNSGDIYVNGGDIRATTAGAFGTGTIHMIDPTAIFGATGTYANNISLEVVTPSSADPATLNADAGVIATLTGAITTSSNVGVDPTQQLVIGGTGTIVLANAANSWTGTTTINTGATLQGASDTISGSAIVNNGVLSYQQAASGTVSQGITGTGNIQVGGLAAGNTLTFAGTNSFIGSILVQDASNVAISGATDTGTGIGVNLGNGASRLDVAATGSLTSSNVAVSGSGANQIVVNLGTITSNGSDAIFMSGANMLVDNSGTVTGSRAISTNSANAQLINRAGATLTGNVYDAVYLANGGTVDNSGTIQALNAYTGIYVAGAAGTITNNAGGSITSQGTGVWLNSAGSSIDNAGTVSATTNAAIYLSAAGSVTNTGTITGGTTGYGVSANAAATITNQTGGTIGGGLGAIFLDGAGLITVNLDAGSTTTGLIGSNGAGDRTINILGTLDGSYAGAGGVDAITLDTGATLTGTLDGGAGSDTLALTGSGSATLGTVFNIESATKSGTGTWTLGTANDVAAWAINGGTLVTGGAILGSASVNIAAGGTLQLSGNQGIGALSGNGIVALGANTLGLLSGTSSFDGSLTGTGNLLIDGANLTFSGNAGYTGLTEVRTGSLTLAAGASFDPASTLLVGTAGTLDLGTTNVTVSEATLRGTLNGTGTLTAAQYALIGATVNGNLGAGTVYSSGATALNGTAAGNVEVQDGTLSLGAANRLADASTVQVDTGATLNLGAFNDTIGVLALGGTLAGTGTLTASQYQLTAATVNANFGAGTLFNVAGTSTLNGTAAGDVSVQAGTLALGAADRLADTATVAVASGATLDIGAFNDTVGALGLNGTLAGNGTLTAGQYQLTGATVNANLGTGTVVNLSGHSTLNGTAAGDVSVQGGTLALGAANRLADTATVAVASGATFDIGAFNDTIGVLALGGTLAGNGTLTAGQYQLTAATVNANLGAGTVFNLGGTSTLNGTAAGNVSVQAGTLKLGAGNRLGDTATVAVASGATLNLGAFNDTIGVLALGGTLAGSGTLTAGQYQLTGATVNANLGAGTLFNVSGISTLNGTAAGDVSVQAGTLKLGAANRLADTATVATAAGTTLDIGAFNDTVGALALGGTLAGTGTLTAAQVQLTAATVNANLGAGTLTNMAGTSVLNGTAAATNVTVQGGTLRLGASDRLADTATVGVASGATFDLATYNETVASIAGTGTIALGTGRLTLNNAGNTAFGGSITGSGTIDKQGIGTLTLAGTFATTGRIDVSAATLAFSGSTQGGIRVQGGTLIGGGTLAGALTLASGTFSPGGLATGGLGAINPIGSFTAGSLVATGGTLLFDFGGIALNFASDSIKVNGTATLSGGTVQVNALTAAASDYRFNQLYTIVQANALTGTFANGSVFATVASNPNLKWRLRYDLVANAVVLQVQKNMEFSDGVAAGDTNTLAVANALSNSTTGNASDSWSATLNTITALNTQQRVAAFKSFSGEILADVSTSTIAANNLFTDLLRQRVGDGSDNLIGGGFAGSSLADVRTTGTAGNSFASSLAGATLPGADDGDAGKGGIWGQVYGGYQKLLGDGVHAGLDTTTAGVAMGVETRMDGFTAGLAGGVAQIDSDMDSRNSTVSGNQYQLGGYVSYDTGSAFVAASGSWYSSDLNSKRTLSVGSAASLATGDIHADGYSVGVTAGFRADLGNGLRLALIGNALKVRNQQDGFTENAAGGLGLQMASANRDLFTAGGELRLGATVKTGSGTAMPWVSMGVRYNSGDLDTAGTMRFSGAPTGTGSFGVQGVRIAPVLGTLGVGIDARASKNVRLGIALEGSAGENTREGRASVRVKIGF